MKCFLFCSLLVTLAHAQTPAQYPKICGLKGKWAFEPAAGGTAKLKMNEILHEKAGFKTESGAMVCVDLSKTDRLIVGENSSVNIPFIELESGVVPEIFLIDGHFRLINESGAERALASDIFRESVRAGDFVVSFDRANVLGTMDVLSGQSKFRGLENEEFVVLKAGESASFRGDAVEGQIEYDVLLKGKKVARGKLSATKSLAPVEIEAFKKKLQMAKVKVVRSDDDVGPGIDVNAGLAGSEGADQTQKGRAKKKKTKKGGDPDVICAKPNGKFDQCAWICEKNPRGAKKCLIERPNVKCVRQRCNANGDWGDRFEFSKDRSPCEAKTVVKACDY